jgi:hypothetical protein
MKIGSYLSSSSLEETAAISKESQVYHMDNRCNMHTHRYSVREHIFLLYTYDKMGYESHQDFHNHHS